MDHSHSDEELQSPGLFRLPAELRLQIYSYLLCVPAPSAKSHGGLTSTPDYYEYEKKLPPTPSDSHAYVVQIRSIERSRKAIKLRSCYKIRAGHMRLTCIDATYAAINNVDLHPAILGVCRQIHAEAIPLLYSTFKFDFDTSIEAAIPFLSDLTPVARQSIRQVRIVKRALPYTKEFDHCEWANMCEYVSSELQVAHLDLGIVAGRPILGWIPERFPAYPKEEFGTISREREEMQWVQPLAKIRSLSTLAVQACVEHCPPPTSNMMHFFVCFSASVEEGLTDYLTELLLPTAAKSLAA